MNTNLLSFLPLGGIGDVTKNMYLYTYQDQILIVDCGIGFADETMLGVDLLLPDISALLKEIAAGKKIVGMLITHGHEDHMGALPFLLPQLPDFSIFATPFTAALANQKLKEFGVVKKVTPVQFGNGQEIKLGVFSTSFIRVTHSVPDTSHIVIKTPAGTIYHGSDYKFDPHPFDQKTTDFASIEKVGEEGVLALMTDCLGAERVGTTPSEEGMEQRFLNVMRSVSGKVLITTYSSNINRINQAIWAAEKLGRKVCFIGRSLIHSVETAKQMGLFTIPKGMEVYSEDLKNIKDSQVLLVVAGSQGQENSAMTRIGSGIHKDVRLSSRDLVIFSSDTIPGNEVMVNSLIDTISKQEVKVLYSELTRDFHVSGHASQEEMEKLLALVKPQYVLPISGSYRHMAAYKNLTKKHFNERNIILTDDGQEVLLSSQRASFGKRVQVKNLYVDQISGEEVEDYVLVDRQQLSTEGIIVIMTQIDAPSGKLVESPDIITRGFSSTDTQMVRRIIIKTLQKTFQKPYKGANMVFLRKIIRESTERAIAREIRRKPLILPIVIEI